MKINREKATEIVQPYIKQIQQYKIVFKRDAIKILGNKAYSKLMADKIRNKGISKNKNTIYYWNIIDALILYKKEIVCKSYKEDKYYKYIYYYEVNYKAGDSPIRIEKYEKINN